jgi:hypothetical protein
VRQTDAALARSAKARGDLGDLRQRVEAGRISRDEALSQIGQIIGQRRELRANFQFDAPSPFRHAHSTLRDSIDVSLQDDETTRRWITAVFDKSPDVSTLRAQMHALDGKASARKQEFLDEYNDLRRKRLGLPAIQPLY